MIQKLIFYCLLLPLFLMINSYGGGSDCHNKVVYETAIIGNQEWMVDNLNVGVLSNGDSIFEAKTDEEWQRYGDEGVPSWCYYQNDPENGATFGRLYNWYAVSRPVGICPDGWRVPSDEDWRELADYLGGPEVAGGKLKDTDSWGYPNFGATNETGFSALPGNLRYKNGHFYRYTNRLGFWWSSSEGVANTAWGYYLVFGDSVLNRGYYYKQSGFSVRCVRD